MCDEGGPSTTTALSLDRLMAVLDSAPVALALVDADRRFLLVNPAMCRLVDRPAEWLLGRGVTDVIHPEDDGVDRDLRDRVVRGASPRVSGQHRLVRSDGTAAWVMHVMSAVDGDGVGPRGDLLVSQYVDITQSRRHRLALEHLANHDPLTGLNNRRVIQGTLRAVLRHPARAGRGVGVLYLDVDGLKTVNDTWGHDAGDRVLSIVGRAIEDHVREDDIVGRIGGDEFAALLMSVGSIADAVRVADGIRVSVGDAMAGLPEAHDAVSVSVGVTIGRPGESVDAVLRRADLALYEAKHHGGDQVRPAGSATRSGSGGASNVVDIRPPAAQPADRLRAGR